MISVILLLLAFVAGGLILGGRGPAKGRTVSAESSPDPAITNDRASGSLGAYKWVGKLGYQAVPLRQGWDKLDRNSSDLLLAVDPQVWEPMATLTGSGQGGSDRTLLTVRDAQPSESGWRPGRAIRPYS